MPLLSAFQPFWYHPASTVSPVLTMVESNRQQSTLEAVVYFWSGAGPVPTCQVKLSLRGKPATGVPSCSVVAAVPCVWAAVPSLPTDSWGRTQSAPEVELVAS